MSDPVSSKGPGLGQPWCVGCQTLREEGCDPAYPACKQPVPGEVRGCLSCRWAVGFEDFYTPTGRLKRLSSSSARCTYQPEWPPVPFFLKESLPGWPNRQYWTRGLWPDDGKDCPCWARRPKP